MSGSEKGLDRLIPFSLERKKRIQSGVTDDVRLNDVLCQKNNREDFQ